MQGYTGAKLSDMTLCRRGAAPILWPLIAAVTIILTPYTARACAIDSTASLIANSVRAQLTVGTPTNPTHWVMFTVGKAFACHQAVQLTEDSSELARTLPLAMLAEPYRWVLGDGTILQGHRVTHRYAHPGTYRLKVLAHDKASKRWFEFDAALLTIVSPDQALQSNLGYYALQALDLAMSAVWWAFDAGLAILILYVIIGRRRKRHKGTT